MLLERLEAETRVQQQAAITNRMLGGDADVPEWPAVRERFDEFLRSQPPHVQLDPEERQLRLALGLEG